MTEEKKLLDLEEGGNLFDDDDMDFLLDDEDEGGAEQENWRVMIVDDDVSVHEATKYAMQDFTFLGKGIDWVDAYSAKEAMLLVERQDEPALIFLDVVMESDTAGLDFVRWLREKDTYTSTRVILRTGQPGQAPEKDVIVNYDLHDYKTKTEMTSDKLFTSTVAALRAYHGMSRLESTKKGLAGIVEATSNIFKIQSMYDYAHAVLKQIESVLDIRSSGILCAMKQGEDDWEILARSGQFDNSDEDIVQLLHSCEGEEAEHVEKNCMIRVLNASDSLRFAVFVEPIDSLSDIQIEMLLMFCNNLSVGISNIKMYNGLLNGHKLTVMSLAQVTESRDQDTGEHVFRIAHLTETIAREMLARGIYPEEINEALVEEIGLSSSLHDIGKVAVPDAVLLKEGRLTDEEFDLIKTHCAAGAQILHTAKNTGERVAYVEMGERIALCHHERWDGRGYPEGRTGKETPVEARITAVADVFDALTHKRCYKDAYPLDEARAIIEEGVGSHFDPEVGSVFLDMLDAGMIEIEE